MSRISLLAALALILCAHIGLASGQAACAGGASNLFEAISRTGDLSIFSSAIRVAEAVTLFTDPALSITVFVPADYAFGNILPPGRGFFDLVPDVAIAQVLVNYHSVDRPLPARLFDEEVRLNTALAAEVSSSPLEPRIWLSAFSKGDQLRLELLEDINSPTGWMVQGALNAANITRTNIIGCNSVVHVIDAILLPDETVLPIGTTTIGEAIEASESFDMLLTPLQPGDAERREEARSRLMLTQVSIETDELIGSPVAEDDPVALILVDAEEAIAGE